MEQVPVQRHPSPPRNLLLAGLDDDVLLLLRPWPPNVAGVVLRISGRLEAKPAEVVVTWWRAPHVVTPISLLDGPLAFRAWLGVHQHPGRRQRVGLVLGKPCSHRGARHRPVSFLAAPPAEAVPARADNIGDVIAGDADELDGAGATRSWAPLDPPAAVPLHVGPEGERGVALLDVLVAAGEDRVDEVAGDGRGAGRVRAPEREAQRAVADGGADEPSPAAVAVEVGGAARRPRLTGREQVEADGTGDRRGADRHGDGLDAVRWWEAGGGTDAAFVREPVFLEI